MSRRYEIHLTSSARKEVRDLEKPIASRIGTALDNLATEPRPSGCRKLEGEVDSWRIRIGDYRIIYAIDDGAGTIRIVAVRHRREAYR
jgi:mRNA interferase RelE/StbE